MSLAVDGVDDETNRISGIVVDRALYVHQRLGPGLFERVYQRALAHALRREGLDVQERAPIAVTFDDLVMEDAYFADLVVDGRVLVEVKSVETLHRAHFAQVQTYLRFTGLRVGLLINFDVPVIKLGIKRIVV